LTKTKILTNLFLILAIQVSLSTCHEKTSVTDAKNTENNKEQWESGVDFIAFPSSASFTSGILCNWENQPCFIAGEKIYRLNINELKAEEIPLPEQLDTIVDLQMSQDERLSGISTSPTGVKLFIENKKGWNEIPFPIALDIKKLKGVTYNVKGNKAFVIRDGTAFFWNGKAWLDKSFGTKKNIYSNPSQILVGAEDLIYMRCNRGEWGGGLGKLNLKSNVFEEISPDVSVYDMTFDKSGTLLFAEEFLNEGALYSLRDKTPKLLCGKTKRKILEEMGSKNKTEPLNWPFNPDVFAAISACSDGSVLVATYNQGVFKFKDRKSIRLTPNWNSGSYINSVLPLPNDQLCFSASEQGVAVLRNKKSSSRYSINTPATFTATFKSLLFNANANGDQIAQKAEDDEKAGKSAQAAAEYLLSSANPAARNESLAIKRFEKCERIIEKLPQNFKRPYMEALTDALLDSMLLQDFDGNFKFRIKLCHRVQDLKKELDHTEDKRISKMILVVTSNRENCDKNLKVLFSEFENGRKVDIAKLDSIEREFFFITFADPNLKRKALLKLLTYCQRDTPQNLSIGLVPILSELSYVSINSPDSDIKSAEKYAKEAVLIANRKEFWNSTPEKLRQDAFSSLTINRGIIPGKLGETEEKVLLTALNLALTCDLHARPNFKQPFGNLIGYYRWQKTPNKILTETQKIISDLKEQGKDDAAKELENELKANMKLVTEP